MHTVHDMEILRQELEMKFNKTQISILTPFEPLIEIIKKIARETKTKVFRAVASVGRFVHSIWTGLADNPPQSFDRISGSRPKYRPDPQLRSWL